MPVVCKSTWCILVIPADFAAVSMLASPTETSQNTDIASACPTLVDAEFPVAAKGHFTSVYQAPVRKPGPLVTQPQKTRAK